MSVDLELFRLINVRGAWDPLVPVMKTVTDFRNFLPFLVVIVAYTLWRGGRRARLTVLALVVLAAATDQTASHVVKPVVPHRPRPCRAEAAIEGVRTYDLRCSSKGSFPSTHATNIAGGAWLLSRRHRRWAIPATLLALLVGYSRVFLGLHYPLDVLGGFALGILMAEAMVRLARRLERRGAAALTAPAPVA